ncbi:hypothetical protein [Photobacterium sanctipauli]|uniref:hypothetical protein n=1 Tax=Photobacterium sanctipauli TaxID=1342794 RepID=UPI000A9655B8|nr:hypothetical protein [Photobacterium sanctipauli]
MLIFNKDYVFSDVTEEAQQASQHTQTSEQEQKRLAMLAAAQQVGGLESEASC